MRSPEFEALRVTHSHHQKPGRMHRRCSARRIGLRQKGRSSCERLSKPARERISMLLRLQLKREWAERMRGVR